MEVGDDRRKGPHSAPSNKLSEQERQQVLDVVNEPEYRNLSVSQIVPRLADKGVYIASESSMYRILRAEGQSTHRTATKPQTRRRPTEFVATAPNQVWTWDITYLKSLVRGQYYYLYMMVDVFSRKIVGRAVHDQESAGFASTLIRNSVAAEQLPSPPSVLHSDNGSPMKGATMLETLRDLGIAASFSRPGVSNDNPFSEALFRTLKYRPEFPSRPFDSLDHANGWVDTFVQWYNTRHLHSAIRFIAPADRHAGLDHEVLRQRHEVYTKAKDRFPRRWAGSTRNWKRIESVRLNPGRHSRNDEVAA